MLVWRRGGAEADVYENSLFFESKVHNRVLNRSFELFSLIVGVLFRMAAFGTGMKNVEIATFWDRYRCRGDKRLTEPKAKSVLPGRKSGSFRIHISKKCTFLRFFQTFS